MPHPDRAPRSKGEIATAGNLVRFGLAALATNHDSVITLLVVVADVNFYRKSPPPARVIRINQPPTGAGSRRQMRFTGRFGRSLARHGRATAATLREDGPLLLLWRILVKLVSPIGNLGINVLYEKDLTPEISPVEVRVPATIRHGTEADIDAVLALQGYPVARPGSFADPGSDGARIDADEKTHEKRRIYLERLRRGETCFLVFVDAELVAFDWMCRQWGEAVPGFPIILEPGEFYGAEAFTAPLWRGLDLHKLVNNSMLRFARGLGCHRCYTTADLLVWRSHRNLRRLGYDRLGTVLWFQPKGTHKVLAMRLNGQIDLLARAHCPARIDALMRRLGGDASRPV
jgi:GNAT superfamily N-acetyltransferase